MAEQLFITATTRHGQCHLCVSQRLFFLIFQQGAYSAADSEYFDG